LVHGAWHGGWCWERVIDELSALGHHATAPDLPCDDPSASFETYADVVEAELAKLGDDAVLVGHSMGGHTIPLVAARRPVRHLVFVGALLAVPGKSLIDQFGEEPDMLRPGYEAGLSEPDELGRTAWVDFEVARAALFADCDEEVARDAFDKLRPQARGVPYSTPAQIDSMRDAPMTYVICEDDQMVDPAWSERVVPERLGIEPVRMPGSHSPFLSRPAELAQLLSRTASL